MAKPHAGQRCTAERILIAEGVLVSGAVLALFLRELPGAIREVKMWQMATRRRGG